MTQYELRWDPEDRRKDFDQDGLPLDSETVRYELEQLVGLTIEHAKRNGDFGSDDVNNACVEAFAIHYRALFDFFFGHLRKRTSSPTPDNSRKTDVFAWDFANDWEERYLSPRPEFLVAYKEEANKKVAHITTDRRGVNQLDSDKISEWPMVDITREICDVMGKFLSLVPADKFADAELDRMKAIIDEFRQADPATESVNTSSDTGQPNTAKLHPPSGVTSSDNSDTTQLRSSLHGKTKGSSEG
ncbi:hypothetical protein Pan216_44860 [Planctomycetes bacterium Pan216]|uniref:Uncharacterized protein n=1 Tax=Kolteria novifilia TaxID=2527975 RepID=A0A518B9E4_9BACT|nr:hypothetical protein Pan216_44860 [Planctomycetes bacterium Pan216]